MNSKFYAEFRNTTPNFTPNFGMLLQILRLNDKLVAFEAS